MAAPNYRPDIDGLRAVAVGSVVVFHVTPVLTPGGFVGVDMFFVISGYLISQVLYDSLERGRFSLLDFYIRRAKRILPALLVVLAARFLIADRELLADEMRAFGRSLIAAASFSANIAFLRDSNYFSSLAVLKPLIHLWSLSVEEQFYIFWPVALAAAWRWRLSPWGVAGAVAIASFVWSVEATSETPIAAFFATQSRAWELMVGAMLAWGTRGRAPIASPACDALSAAALLLIGFAVFFTRGEAFPGLGAVPAVLGAALMIAAGPRALVNRLVLARSGMVALGLISYPLYLWHWPLLSFARVVAAAPTPIPERALLALLAVPLAALTYLWVERPIRFGTRSRLAPLGLTAGLLVAAALGAGAASGAMDGAPWRTPDRAAFALAFDDGYPEWRYRARERLDVNFRDDCNFYDPAFLQGGATRLPRASIAPSCTTRDPAKRRAVFLWGDSHAQMLYGGLRAALPADWQVLIVASSSCAPEIVADSATDYCWRSNFVALRAIEQAKPDVVVIARVDDHRYAEMKRLGDRLAAIGVNVLFTGPTPQYCAPLPAIEQRRLWDANPERTRDGLVPGIFAENDHLRRDFADAGDDRLVDLIGFFCNEAGCLTRVGPERLRDFVSFDYGHLTPVASRFLARGLLAARVERAVGDAVEVAPSVTAAR
ncbi:MAG: acyltransferase family protein [Roseiarcus sp.]